VRKYIEGLLIGILIGSLVFSYNIVRAQTQGGPMPAGTSPATQTATRADAGIQCQSTSASATAITFNAIPGLTFYLTEFDVSNSEDATGPAVGAVETISTSNLPGSIAWTVPTGPATTPGTNTQTFQVSYPTGLKSLVPGTATSITNATTVTHQVVRINACGFYA